MATLLSRPWVQTDSCIKTVQRHLDGVESIIVRQHFEMYRRAFVSGETNKTNLACFFASSSARKPRGGLGGFSPDSRQQRQSIGARRPARFPFIGMSTSPWPS